LFCFLFFVFAFQRNGFCLPHWIASRFLAANLNLDDWDGWEDEPE